MWTVVQPLISQCSKTFNVAKRGRLFVPGATTTLLGSQVFLLPRKLSVPLVYLPLKDYEVVALQQLS